MCVDHPPLLAAILELTGRATVAMVSGAGTGPTSPAPHQRSVRRPIVAREKVLAVEPLDLNRASLEELILTIGISESTAEGIIDFRDANGGFDSVEDLMEVECVSESSYRRIRLKVTV
jgi:competence ComEA-like helix-hairpin-helix protein